MIVKTIKSSRNHSISLINYRLSTVLKEVDDIDEFNSYKKIKFVDRVTLIVQGGKGGNGCISFIELTPGKRRATGGSGGRGGNVYLRSNKSLFNLTFDSVSINAKPGAHGKGDSMTGKDGEDVIIEVPVGTIVTERLPDFYDNTLLDEDEEDDDDSDNEEDKEDEDGITDEDEEDIEDDENDNEDDSQIDRIGSIFEFDKHNQILLVASGGSPGLGNQVTSGTNQQKKKSTPASKFPGEPGQRRTIQLELKLIADIGLVGFPNAGKSTLLRALSNARPKVAAYPFTTLHPHIGVLEYSDFDRVTVADIPGIIEGAHLGRGLGLDFLRHIERTKALLFVIDAAATESRKPASDLLSLINELEAYGRGLLDKPAVVLANKSDLNITYSHSRSLKELCRKYKMKLLFGSGENGEGLLEIAKEIRLLKERADKSSDKT